MSGLRRVVVPEGAPERLDRFLAQTLGLSRARVKAMVEAGRVRLDGRRARKGDPLRAGMQVEVQEAEPGPPVVPQPELPLAVLYEDDAVLVLDKPAGAPTHPLEPGEQGTLANALAARHPECLGASEDPRECGIAHRLDTGTSGAIVAARNRAAYAALREAFRSRRVEKRYVALVDGALGEEGEVQLPLANDPKDRRRVIACGSDAEAERRGAEQAITRYRVRERRGRYQLVDVEIVTGVRHQIRAHLAAIGAPVVGDGLYGGPVVPGLGRPFLHAAQLAFPHPSDGHRVAVESPLAPDLSAYLASLPRSEH